MKHIKTQITFCLLLITSLAFAQKESKYRNYSSANKNGPPKILEPDDPIDNENDLT